MMDDFNKDGGPAFPKVRSFIQNRNHGQEYLRYTAESSDGMSLRDWFAGQGAAAIISTVAPHEAVKWDDVASGAYFFADEMLKAREPK